MNKIVSLFSLLITALCLTSCQSENDDYYINGDSKYERRVLKDPYKTIKEDYYQQVFANNHITDDAELIRNYVPNHESLVRNITYDSILFYGIYDIYEGAYICDFWVNYNVLSYQQKPVFTVNEVEYQIGTQYIEPAVWKNGSIYNMQGAVDDGIIPFDLVNDLFGNGKYTENFTPVEANLITEFRYHLPPLKNQTNEQNDFPYGLEISEDNRNVDRFKKVFYKQMFYDKQINDDRNYNDCFIPRLVEPRSILLFSSSKIKNETYFLTFMVNGFGLLSGSSGYNYLIGEYHCSYPLEVFVYASGRIYKLDEAFNKKVFSFSEFEKYITVEESNIQIHEYPTLEYINNLPALNRA